MSGRRGLGPPQGVGRDPEPSLPNFDRVARLYRWAEYLALGPLLTRTREQYLAQLGNCRQALLLGDGDGRFTAALLRTVPHLQAQAVDGSGGMLALLGARCSRDGNAGRVSTEQRSVLTVQPDAATDLIVTHFLLDCLTQTEVDRLARRLAGQVRPGCRWLVSDFAYPRRRLLRAVGAAYIRALYLAFRMLTGLRPQRLPDPQKALHAAGFRRLTRRERLGGLLYTELWQLAQPTSDSLRPQVQAQHNRSRNADINP